MSLSRVLCVDDEPQVLESLTLHLRKDFLVSTASSGAEGLEKVMRDGPFQVVLSDMRMPGMDGATFLARVREQVPDAIRMLLTGFAEVESAISAVNDGQVFRFLTKPCPPTELKQAFGAAAEQYRLITAEKVLLEQTLQGCVKALTDVLALTNPVAFGRAMRIQQHVSELVQALGADESWAIEMAAMLSQIGCVTLPVKVLDKIHSGQALEPDEESMRRRVPVVTEQLLANIPRLETVRAILTAYERLQSDGPEADGTETVILGARMLRIATDFDDLENRGLAPADVLREMSARAEQYDAVLLEAFRKLLSRGTATATVRELSLSSIQPGMVLVEDMHTSSGAVLAPRGFEITPGFLELVQNNPDHPGEALVRVTTAASSSAETAESDSVPSQLKAG